MVIRWKPPPKIITNMQAFNAKYFHSELFVFVSRGFVRNHKNSQQQSLLDVRTSQLYEVRIGWNPKLTSASPRAAS